MANIKSQIKRNRQNEKRHDRNQAIRSDLKTASKKALAAADAGEAAEAEALLQQAQRKYDKAVSGGVLHAKTAARRKSRLTAQVRTRLS